MLKAIGWVIKLALFSMLVLVLGNLLHWHGRTISDQVKTQLSHAERSDWGGKVKEWGSDLTEDARKGIRKQMGHPSTATGHSKGASRMTPASAKSQTVAQKENSPEEGAAESIPSSERQKLRALIRELNSSSGSSTN